MWVKHSSEDTFNWTIIFNFNWTFEVHFLENDSLSDAKLYLMSSEQILKDFWIISEDSGKERERERSGLRKPVKRFSYPLFYKAYIKSFIILYTYFINCCKYVFFFLKHSFCFVYYLYIALILAI